MIHLLKWLGGLLLTILLLLLAPIAYTELACRGEPIAQEQAKVILAPEDHRAEARTYKVYPEWHIVYAYEGYAAAIASGAPHDFPYLSAIGGFWSSLCSLTSKADELGEAGFDSKATIYTIGVSFTMEMTLKAIYEETFGWAFALTGDTSAQDQIEQEMAADYAAFLQQTPWYKYDFDTWATRLWQADISGIRSWERRLAIGAEWKAKSSYAGVIAQAVGALGADELTVKIAVENIDREWLATQSESDLKDDGVLVAEVPRYRVFTELATEITRRGGTFVEIAGNDDILVSVIGTSAPELVGQSALVSATRRPGFEDRRYLIAVKVSELANLIRSLATQNATLEHIYDY